MKRAILKKFILILALALTLSGSIFGVAISRIILDKTGEDLLYSLRIADYAIDYDKSLKPQLDRLKRMEGNPAARYTIMDLKGNILADSDVDSPVLMENHAGREEVKEAVRSGHGYARRKSDTLAIPMLYVSCISENEEYILRIAVPFTGLISYTGLLFPAIMLSVGISLVLSVILAVRFSKTITRPLSEIAEELLKLKEEDPKFRFGTYEYDEMNIIADITRHMAEAVKEARNKLEFEKLVRQEFFSNASHELKTPLTSILGYVELLETGMAADENRKSEFLNRIKKETANMTNLINDILLISRLETKEVQVTLSEVRLCPLMKEVCASLEPMAKELGVTINISCRPIVMKANASQLRELFGNLISNAIKYNKPDGSVSVTVTSEGKDVVIIVEDTGVGIPEKARQRVFERFYRVDKGRSKKMGGTGLGLSIVKHVVNYYNGTIELESRLGEGSKFTVSLPLDKQIEEYT